MEVPAEWTLSFNDHPSLKIVSLDTFANSSSDLRAIKISQLEDARIAHIQDFTANDWKVFTTNNPNITSLTIHSTPLTTEGLNHIVSNLSNLEKISILADDDNDAKFEYADIKLILENCTSISKINMGLYVKRGFDEIFEEFGDKLRTIGFYNKYGSGSDADEVMLDGW